MEYAAFGYYQAVSHLWSSVGTEIGPGQGHTHHVTSIAQLEVIHVYPLTLAW